MEVIDLMRNLTVNEPETENNFHIFSAAINSQHTDIVFSEFTDKCIIIATQYEKLGTLCRVTVDRADTTLDITEPVYTVTTLFGADNVEQVATARFIAEKLSIEKSLLIFLALKDYSRDTITALIAALQNVPEKL